MIIKNFKEPQSPFPLRGSQTAHTSRINTPVVILSIENACQGVNPATGLVTQIPGSAVFKML